MSFIVFLIVGLIAGAIAKAIMPGARDEPSGWLMTMILGVAGAYVGGFLGSLIGVGAGNIIGEILVSAVGAMVLIGLMRLFTSRA